MGEVVCDLGKSGNTTNTTTHNSDFPAPHSRKVTTPATRCVHPSAYRTCRVAGVRTLHALVCPSRPHVDPLSRAWPVSSARGPAIPSLGNPAHVRNRRPTCETAGSHAGHVGAQVTVAHSQSMTDHGAATHTGPRCSIHRNEANTTTYNSDFPAPHSRQVTTPATRFVQPPSWPQPTKTPTFPHQQAKKSPQNQYVASYNPSVL